MLFRRVIVCALLVGLCAGLIHSAIQRLQVVPIIAAAEVFESALEAAPPAHDHAAHDHGAWEPQAGLERTAWTVIANVLAAIGFALVLVPALAAWDRTRRDGSGASIATGLLWGAAGWVCFYVWPALGLPPELPGEASAALGARQAWWALAVACALAGLSLLCLVRAPWRLAGLVLLALPFVVGAPHLDGSPFAAFNAEAAAQMAALKQRFLVATAIASAVHWLALGALSGATVRRWLRPLLTYTSPRKSGEREGPARSAGG